MANCKCGEEYSDARKALGYDTCLGCGEEEAQAEVEKRRERVVVPYNKGPYMFLISKKELTGLGK